MTAIAYEHVQMAYGRRYYPDFNLEMLRVSLSRSLVLPVVARPPS